MQPLGPAGDGAAAGMKEDGRAGRGVGAGAALPQPSAGVHGELARDPAATRRLPAARAPPGPRRPVPLPCGPHPLPLSLRPSRPQSPRRPPLCHLRGFAPRAPPPAPRPPALLPGRRARLGRVPCGPRGLLRCHLHPHRACPPWIAVAASALQRVDGCPEGSRAHARRPGGLTRVRAGTWRGPWAACRRWRRTELGPGALRATSGSLRSSPAGYRVQVSVYLSLGTSPRRPPATLALSPTASGLGGKTRDFWD